MTRPTRSSVSSRLAPALLVAVALAAGPAAADRPHHGGPPPGPGGMIEHVLATMKDQLALDTSQQVAFERISGATLAARDQSQASRAGVRATVDAELAKAEPDLAAVASAFDAAEDAGRAARRQVRDQWLAFYANLRPDQKAIVRDAIRDRIERFGEMRERMHERKPRKPA